ncbi:type II toxin-antitoxin system HicB family antitoxin [candidate division KSB1 bacterium]|nr:type II toxin-antitoxin system HicB family antitoxin [candidate division KSB1 bacterium]
MQYTVLIQPRRNGGFTASVPTLPGCRSQGATEDEALDKIRAAIANHLKDTKIVQVEVTENGVVVPKAKNPWDSIIGMFENDPIFEEVDRRIKQDRERELRRLKNKARRR